MLKPSGERSEPADYWINGQVSNNKWPSIQGYLGKSSIIIYNPIHIAVITIKHTDSTSDISLAALLMVRTKEYMVDTCKKLDLYVSPNLKKEETAHRIARDYPVYHRKKRVKHRVIRSCVCWHS